MNTLQIIEDSAAIPHESIPPGSDGVVFACVRPKPIRTALPGRIRVRLRNDEFARATVMHNRNARHFILINFGYYWELGFEHGAGCHYRADLPQ